MATVFWFTGLAGAGKSTLATLFYQELNSYHPTLLLDGDTLREVLGAQHAYSIEERRSLAFQYARLCQMLVKQNVHVIFATISMFDEVRAWNRKSIENYCEIYVRAPMSVLKQRNQKELYSNKSPNEVIGLDLCFEEPKNPDLILDNDGKMTPNEQIVIIKERFFLCLQSAQKPKL